jgi:hypothetical protein
MITRLRDGRPGLNLWEEQEFFSLSPRSGRILAPPIECVSEVNQPQREAEYSSPSSAEVKSAPSNTSTSQIDLHGVVLN